MNRISILVILLLVFGVGVLNTQAQEDPTEVKLSTFDSDTEGWTLELAGVEGELSHTNIGADCHSAALEVSYSGQGNWEEAGIFYRFEDEPYDLSAYATYSVDVFIDSDANPSDFRAQLYVKTGGDWQWNASNDIPVSPGQWTTLSMDLATLENRQEAHEIGLKIGATITAFTGNIYLDNITFRLPNGDPAPLYFDFEVGLQDWQIDYAWINGMALNHSAQTGSNCGALRLVAEFKGIGSYEYITLSDPLIDDIHDFSAFGVLVIEVYTPPEVRGFFAQVYLTSQADGSWQGTSDIQLIPGEWTTLQLNLAELYGINEVQRLGVRIGGTLNDPLPTEFLIDNVRLTDGQSMVEATEAPSTVATASPTSVPTEGADTPKVTVLYDFEAGITPWEIVKDWPAGKEPLLHGAAPDGGSCLQLNTKYPGESFVDAGVKAVLSDVGMDWSGYTSLEMDIYLPPGLEDGGIRLYLKHGPDWTWAESEFINFNGRAGWIQISATLLDMKNPADPSIAPDLTRVHEVGLKLGTESQINAIFCIDNVRLVTDQTPPPPVSSAVPCTSGESVLVTPAGLDQVNIRSGPSESATPVGKLLRDQSVAVYARNETGEWLRLSPDNEWWVARSVIRVVQGDVNALPLSTPQQDTSGTTWLYTFNTDILPWEPVPDMIAGRGVSHSITPDDLNALSITVAYSGAAYEDAGASVIVSNEGVDWSQCTRLAIDLYIKPGLSQGGVTLFIKSGEEWTWFESTYIKFEGASGWIPISVVLLDMRPHPYEDIPPDLTDVREMGVKVGSAYKYDGFVFIDNVRLLR